MSTPEDRYLHDVEFHTLVDVIYQWIERLQYTPTEVREAAMLAALHYSLHHPRAMVWPLPPEGERR